MTTTKKPDFNLTGTQEKILSAISRSRTATVALVWRSTILLRYAGTHNKSDVVRHLGSTWDMVNRWVDRWRENHIRLERLEAQHTQGSLDQRGYRNEVIRLLTDRQRNGAPPTFTESQKQQIIALASQKPTEHGIPVTHWSHEIIAHVAGDTGIVTSISRSQVGRFLKAGNSSTA